MTFRARLHATPQTNTTELINHMLQWVENGATISVGGVLLNVVPDCDLVITSFSDPECEINMDEEITTVSTLPSTTMTLTTTEGTNQVEVLLVTYVHG